MTTLDADTVALLNKRVYDVAACNPGLDVWLTFDAFLLRLSLINAWPSSTCLALSGPVRLSCVCGYNRPRRLMP